MDQLELKQEIRRKEIKEALAKLMATENITVEHAPVPTAAFDILNRKLVIPNWQNISEDVYSLLISHEVGHALYTPLENWEKAIKSVEEKDAKSFKSVVNIVEDVRIEKMIQDKYPGAKRSFRAGYAELEEANLFGTRLPDGNQVDFNEFGILDRLNIHFKVGHYGYAQVPFESKEQKYVTALEAAKTFDDVVEISRELLKYAKEEKEEKGDKIKSPKGNGSGEFGDGDGDTTIEVGSKEEAEKLAKEIKSQAKAGNGPAAGKGKVTIKYPGGEIVVEGDPSNAANGQLGGRSNGEGVGSVTQDYFDKKMREYIDLTNNTLYLNIPKYDLKKIIVDYSGILVQFRNHYNGSAVQLAKAEEALSHFKQNNKPVVNQLVNLFEMKKRAKADSRAMISKTGILDTNKIHSYRYNEDIFRKVTTVPNGKNHGLVMFLDMSGSMGSSMPGTIAQIINLVMFCKKVNIPFEVYGFSDLEASKAGLGMGNRGDIGTDKVNDVLIPGNFSLRNYLSSRMSHSDYNEMLLYLTCVMLHYRRDRNVGSISIPRSEALGGTPLNEAIISAMQIVPEFKANNRLDIVNTVVLTDGDGTSGFSYNRGQNSTHNSHSEHIFMRHNKTRKTYVMSVAYSRGSSRYGYGSRDITANLFDMYRDITGTKMIGFYISNKDYGEHTVRSMTNNDHKEQLKQLENWKTKSYAEVKADGYDVYYIIPDGDELLTAGEDLDLGDAKQQRTIQKRFIEAMSKKKASRIMLNRFMDNIA